MVKLSKIDLEELLEKLSEHRGRHTELITVYIPAGYDVNAVQRQIEGEKSTAKNIKSTATRKNVTDALDKIVRYLKTLKVTPENGLAVFSGNVSQIEGQGDLQLWDIEPPLPMKHRMYRCDKEFVLEPLHEQLEVKEIFGLLVMDRKEATVGVLEGKRIEVIQKMTSGVPGKVKAGGQSAQRYHRITEGLTKDFYKRIAEEMKQAFFENPKLKGILIGGPIPTKDEFLDGEYLTNQLQEKVLGRIDLGDTDESGLKELVKRSQDILASQEIIKEKKILEKFFTTLGEKSELVVYDEEGIRKAFQYGAVELLILSKETDKVLAKELKTLAEQISSNVEVVSIETEEGQQFLSMTKKGIGVILRFQI
ncbi:peptide chain release factor 1 [archaeon]|jgi:peptide chain release factor subunit 1|nr:peptide chain release factor 1 [archaeon]MBT4373632.1 peptide chain release factor 1 [archaeon]MBT4531686.1 peptide chain release factor 1 [archaeon]MBT7001798.1 peptide chain release factor 1 [archaeon]MBT7281783.1 peptide chain release factor 1 [archaeon]